MKIAVVDTDMNDELVGGAQLFLPGLISGLIGRGHDVYLIAKGEINPKVRHLIDATGVKTHSNLWNISAIVEDAAPMLTKWVNNLAPDIFLISTSADIGWVTLPLVDADIATLAIGHNDLPTYYEPARHYRDFLTRAIGVSNEVRENYALVSGIEKDRIDWIPYGVRSSSTLPTETNVGALKMVYVGRLEEGQKRISDILKVVNILSAKGTDFLLQIVGDGVSMPMVREHLAVEIAAGKVVLHGWLDGESVLKIVRESEVFILASAFEGFCIALVEAMANGCAPVVTDIKSGNKQLVEDGVNGFIVPVGDIAAFTDKIELLAADRAKLLEFRQRAWETGRQYSVERMVENYERCFTEAVKNAREHPRTPDQKFPLMESCRSNYPLWLRRIVAEFRS